MLLSYKLLFYDFTSSCFKYECKEQKETRCQVSLYYPTGKEAEALPLLGGRPETLALPDPPSTPSLDDVDLLDGFRRNLETRENK